MEHTDPFGAFVNNKSRQKGNLLEDRKSFWVKNVEALFTRIKKRWLKPYNKINIEEQEIEIAEPFLGTYKLKSLLISLGPERVIVKPVSSEVIGGYGRVDLIGKSEIFILLLNGEGQWEYKIKTPFVEFHQLDKQSFRDMVKALME